MTSGICSPAVFVEIGLREAPVLSEGVAVVAEEHDEGVRVDPGLLKRREDPPDAFIGKRNGRSVSGEGLARLQLGPTRGGDRGRLGSLARFPRALGLLVILQFEKRMPREKLRRQRDFRRRVERAEFLRLRIGRVRHARFDDEQKRFFARVLADGRQRVGQMFSERHRAALDVALEFRVREDGTFTPLPVRPEWNCLRAGVQPAGRSEPQTQALRKRRHAARSDQGSAS